ncbi:glycoside hydrolase family protein [Sphingobium aromaticiconvertens]|uniref:glycoside hydrolase family protein n=1 Tax=Sphingobium aromaticiconvertens TaxID=365341 RepID=UPI00301B11DC
MAKLSLTKNATLAVLMGSAAAATAYQTDLIRWEGMKNVGYLDIAKIPTKCAGDTSDVVVGKMYSDAECQASLTRQATAHVGEVLQCTPQLKGRPQLIRAAGLLTYNIGGPNYCRSTAAARFKAGNFKGGCEAIGPEFVVTRNDGTKVKTTGFINITVGYDKKTRKAILKPVQGLINRRAYERDVCLKGLV